MGKGTKMAVTFGSWGAVAFDLMGWVLLLSGVASMQKVRQRGIERVVAGNMPSFSQSIFVSSVSSSDLYFCDGLSALYEDWKRREHLLLRLVLYWYTFGVGFETRWFVKP